MFGFILGLLLVASPEAVEFQHARADDPSPDAYPAAVFMDGDLAAAIPIAANRLLGPQTRAKDCFDQLRSYRVHVSKEADVITVVFLPNKRCGAGIKGGGGRVTLDAVTLAVRTSKGFE